MADIIPIKPPAVNDKLTPDECHRIGGALARLNDIKNQSIISLSSDPNTPNSEEEARALIEYLSVTLIRHASELIGCWFVIKGEYAPLINALAPLAQRLSIAINKPSEGPQ